MISTTFSQLISPINNDLSWKLLGSETGSTAISLPASFSELHVKVSSESNNKDCVVLNILRGDTSATEDVVYRAGWDGGSYNVGCIVRTTKQTSISTIASTVSGASVLSSSITTVYYR